MAQLPAIVAGHGGSGTTTSVTITAASAGNVLVLFFTSFRSAGARTISSLSTTNVTWTKQAGVAVLGLDTELWTGVVSGGSSGTTVTITMSGTGSTIACRVDEFTGVAIVGTAVIVDTSVGLNPNLFSSNQQNVIGPQIFSVLCPNTGDLLLACLGQANGTAPTIQPPSPWVAGTFVNNSTSNSIQPNYIPNGATDNAQIGWTLSASVQTVAVVGALKSTAGFQIDYIKTRTRAYDSPIADLYQPLKFIFPTPVVVDSLPWKRLNRLYDAPTAELYSSRPFPSWLSFQQFDYTEYWIPPKRLYVQPDSELGGRRGRWLPDNSGLGGDQTSHLRMLRAFDAPTAEIYPTRLIPAWLVSPTQRSDQLEWRQLRRFYDAPTPEVFPSRPIASILVSPVATTALEEERVRVGGFYGIQVPDVYVGGV